MDPNKSQLAGENYTSGNVGNLVENVRTGGLTAFWHFLNQRFQFDVRTPMLRKEKDDNIKQIKYELCVRMTAERGNCFNHTETFY